MKTIRLIIIAVALLLCCPTLLSAQDKWYMTSFKSDEGKELVITEKYVFIRDAGDEDGILYGYSEDVEDRSTLWVFQLDGEYDAGTITLNTDGTLTYDTYDVKRLFKKDVRLKDRLLARVDRYVSEADAAYWEGREAYTALVSSHKWLEGCWKNNETGAFYIITEKHLVYYYPGTADYSNGLEVMEPECTNYEEGGSVDIYPSYRLDDTSSRSENGLSVNLKTRTVESYFGGTLTKFLQ